MAVPTPPTPGEPIAEAWGDVVHEGVVARDIQAGVATINVPSGGFSGTGSVVFPRPFGGVPVVTIGGPSTTSMVNVGAITATGFNTSIRQRSDVAIPGAHKVQWIAYGARA